MSRARSIYDNDFRYLDRTVSLNKDGKFQTDYGTIHDTLDEAKTEIKSRQQKRDKAPKFDVWFRKGASWSRAGNWVQGQTTGHHVSNNGEVIVTFTEDGHARRENHYDHAVYPVNEHNDKLIEKIRALDAQIEKLEADRSDLKEQLQDASHLSTD